jgi:hypothetical protein
MGRPKKKQFDGLSIHDFRVRGKPDERRRETRFSVQRFISLLSCDAPSDDGFVKVQLIDCSLHGLGILTAREMGIGERFLIKVQLQRIMLAVYTTRYCRREAKGFQIGAELSGFIGGISDDPQQVFDAFVKDSDQDKLDTVSPDAVSKD